MQLIILTGMSGAGKSRVSEYLEDMGYFCIDNLPPNILFNLVKTFLFPKNETEKIEKLALVVDARSTRFFADMNRVFADLDSLVNDKEIDFTYKIIYMNCSDEVILARYKQTRRIHPLSKNSGLEEAIKFERKLLIKLQEKADEIIDTSNYTLSDLRNYIYALLSDGKADCRMQLCLVSFGYKYGLPSDCDLVYDMRFLPNPYYDLKLRKLNGLDKEISDFLDEKAIVAPYLDSLTKNLLLVLPYYIREGKVRLTIGIGCTGGRHRSVAMAERIAKILMENSYLPEVRHRDLERDLRNIHKKNDYQA